MYFIAVFFAATFIGYLGLPFFMWTIFILALGYGLGLSVVALSILGVLLAIFLTPPLRRIFISSFLMKMMKNLVPKISETERTALEAGVVWVESDLFSGKPDFKKLINEDYSVLSSEEQEFLNGPTNELCKLLNDWEIWRTRKLSDESFNFIKEKGFLGMIIPKKYGGLGFSASAHADVIAKISSRSITAAITVMVPNSLGPAELLLHYGTEEQKNTWLPKLASGEVVPCFGLTEPNAGSDAGAITSEGVLFKGEDGRVKIRLNWNKRWITLASISDVIGLAFKLKDPEGLIGDNKDIGITCALIPSKAQGVHLGRRHDPLSIPFYNCPTQGVDVIVDAENSIIGGIEKAGHGWKMLMESLGAGRGVSLPSLSCGGNALCARVSSNHAMIRKQFGVSIGLFEGVQEPLARIGASNYYLEAMRRYTLGALDRGIAPPVVTAMCKYYATEKFRDAVNDSMDVLGGAGISLGPKNLIGSGFMASPISITVEGANILTRTLMIFGQGALRAHPFAFKEVDAIGKGDLVGFDHAFWGHIGHVVRNTCRIILLSLTRGHLSSRGTGGAVGRYYQKLSWASTGFALLADIAMGLLGGKLKFKEKLAGRFADILSWMYIAMATLRRFEAEGSLKEDLPLVHYSLRHAFSQIQRSFEGIHANLEVPVIGWIFKYPIRWLSRFNRFDSAISDSLGTEVVKIYTQDSAQRDRLTSGIYIPTETSEALGFQEQAFKATMASKPIVKKIKKAMRAKQLKKGSITDALKDAVSQSIITSDEMQALKRAEELCFEAIQVDCFTEEEYVSRV